MRTPKRRRDRASNDKSGCAIPFQKCYAKTYDSSTGKKKTGRTVLEHCQIVAEVARELISRFPPELAKILFPLGCELIAGAHDVGKVCPTFQKKILRNTYGYTEDAFPALKNINPQLETGWGGHATVSQLTLSDLNAGKYIPEIVGQHHGFTPPVGGYIPEGEVFGGKNWQQERIYLIEELRKRLDAVWPRIENCEQARLIAGLTTVADWIGSGEFFEKPDACWQDNIHNALDNAGFIPPKIKKSLTFDEIFGFKPYTAQAKLIEHVVEPGVYVLEAPMGHGKTEAALYAGYRILAQKKARGVYFALPTQLTSNKIYNRFNIFLKNILEPECSHRKALLIHGAAWLLEYTEMGEEGQPGRTWFNNSKRGLVAPFAVGTIDQALMAEMNVKHGTVRAFGLAGKVVILDEVHTYDIYTGTILVALVKMLREMHCTVIILSATLTRERRRQLVGGRLNETGYPLITASYNEKPAIEAITPVLPSRQFELLILSDDSKALEMALERAATGQQVLWIENSVQEAQDCFLNIAARAAELGVECGLLHSRFTTSHRHEKEEHWVNLFGKAGWNARIGQGRILMGTQVLEQSLDIDADFLITRFCPTDMIFQRLGRLWRHEKTPRHSLAKREACLLAPKISSVKNNPEKAFGVSGWIYNPYVLCRSFEVWKDRDKLKIPTDIRPLIEATYHPRKENGEMHRLKNELRHGNRYRKGTDALEQLAQTALSKDCKTLPETKAKTRYSEADTIEVLLVRDILCSRGKKETRMILLDGQSVIFPWNRYVLPRKTWKRITARLMKETINTKPSQAPMPLSRKILENIGLANCFYLGEPEYEETLLRIAIVDKAGFLSGYQGAPLHEKSILKYRNDLGYQYITPK